MQITLWKKICLFKKALKMLILSKHVGRSMHFKLKSMTGCILAPGTFLETSVFIHYAYIYVRLSFPVCSHDFQIHHIFWIKKFFMPGQYLVLMGRLIYLWISSLSAQQVFTKHPHAGRLRDRHPLYGDAYRTEHSVSRTRWTALLITGRGDGWSEMKSRVRGD